jgi:alpha-glucosidase
VIWHLIKDASFRDNPPNPAYRPTDPEINRLLQVHSTDQPEVHDVVRQMRAVIDERPDRVLIGEIYLPLERLVAYYGADLSGAHLPFNFQLIFTGWNARELTTLINEYEAALPDGGWPNWVLGNHDQPRIAARVGASQARVAAMMLLTLRGTPTMYYGYEIGLGRIEIPPDDVQDPWEKNEPGRGLGRDPQRTPMQWDASANAGFTQARPWLPVDAGFATRNVAELSRDPGSILNLYRTLIALRRRHPALHAGRYAAVTTDRDVLAYEREHGADRLLILLNMAHRHHTFRRPAAAPGAVIIASTQLDRAGELVNSEVELRPDEGLVVRL